MKPNTKNHIIKPYNKTINANRKIKTSTGPLARSPKAMLTGCYSLAFFFDLFLTEPKM